MPFPYRLALVCACSLVIAALTGPRAQADDATTGNLAAADGNLATADGDLATADGDLVAELIGQLGAASYAEREKAARGLADLGIAARKPLEAALDNADAEVRQRARRILDYVLDRDFQQRLQAFAADADGSRGQDLPGWDRFRRTIGEDAAARRLFVDMQRSESLLLEAFIDEPAKAGRILDARLQALRADSFIEDAIFEQPRSVGQAAALLFVGADPAVPLSDASCDYVAAFVRQQSFYQQAAGTARYAAPLKKLLSGWVGRYFGDGRPIHRTNLFLAIEYQLPEGLSLASRMVADPRLEANVKPVAILAVARFGDRDEVPLLAPLLADATVLQKIDERQSEVRDVALAGLLHLTGQAPRDYGLELEPEELLDYDPLRFGYATAEEREAAFARWDEWATAHLPQVSPP